MRARVRRSAMCVLCAGMLLHVPGVFAGQAGREENPTLLAQAPLLPAQPDLAIAAAGAGMQGRISLDLRNIDIVDALKFLATKAQLNIITTKAVTGRVTLLVTSAVIQDVFDVMIRSNNLAYDQRGDIYNVMTQEEYRILYGKNFSDVRKVKVFYLKYAIPEQAFSMLDMIKSEVGRVMVDPETGNVLAMDSPERLELMETALSNFEEKNTVKVFKLNYGKAKEVEEALKNQLDSKKVGLIKADERGNQLIVQTLPDRMDQIERLIKNLDRRTREVIIDVSIVKVQISSGLDSGVQWEGIFDLGLAEKGLQYLGTSPFAAIQATTDTFRTRNQVRSDLGNDVGSIPFTGTSTSYSAGRKSIGTQEMHLGVVGRQDFDVIIKYLATIGKTNIISNPKLAVVNNQEAKIHVGSKEAYVTSTTTTGQTTNTVAEQVTFVDIGVLLSVVPVINDEDFINLKVKAEISEVIDTLITPTNNQIPIIDSSLAETTVLVKDGSTVIIGGLRKETKVSSSSQVPFLGSIPILGRLFSQKSDSKQQSELLIILTPRLITGEVLVSDAGVKSPGQMGFKGLKEYERSLTMDVARTLPHEVFIPVEDMKLPLKGVKQRTR
ncbi:MAG: secretin N-terminal domain-containing protein [Candidatus Omnitrophica bacterium]|nr:secretin N-terminal domain-containing protein [Candidatus Omnitrophota bacterium]